MSEFDYATLEDGQLFELIFTAEDRLERKAALEIARRDGLAPYLAEVVGEKQNWLAELPEWWAVVHASYLLAQRGGEETVLPLLSALRWSDAFDCDWVTELLPAMLGRVGPPMLPGLTAVARDLSAGWSARDLAMKGLAAITLHHPESREHVFRIIGERFMDEGEERLVRQLAGHVLLDFRVHNYRLALLVFAREEEGRDEDQWLPAGFTPEEVEWTFKNPTPEVWHYQEDWLRFYDPAEIQRRQKRWVRERLGTTPSPRERVPAGGGRVLPLSHKGKKPEGTQPTGGDPESPRD